VLLIACYLPDLYCLVSCLLGCLFNVKCTGLTCPTMGARTLSLSASSWA
jgi:hypothetical protein